MIDILEILEKEYPGDEAWNRYCNCFSNCKPSVNILANIDSDMAKILISKLGTVEHVNNWLSSPLSALDGDSAICILEESKGTRVIRSLLMRLP